MSVKRTDTAEVSDGALAVSPDLEHRGHGSVPLSIMIVSNLFPPRISGGAEMSAHALALGFVEKGHRVCVFTLKEKGDVERTFEDGMTVHRVPAHLPYWPFDQKDHSTSRKIAFHLWDNFNLTIRKQFEVAVEELKPDIISTQGLVGISAAVWHVAARHHIPVVHSLRDYNAMCPRSTLYRGTEVCQQQCVDCKALTAIRKHVGRSVAGVIANSDYVAERHKRAGYFPDADWDVVPPTINLETIVEERRPQTSAIRFGFAGRISREKGPEWLIDALNTLSRDNWSCIVAGRGDPDYVARLQDKARGRVEFVGWMPPSAFYASIDVLVAPSLWAEPAGRVVAEAYANGLPVIAARNGGLAEGVIPGVTGWLVEPGSVEDLAIALEEACDPVRMATLDRGRMAQIAQDRSTHSAIERYSRMFAQAISRSQKVMH